MSTSSETMPTAESPKAERFFAAILRKKIAQIAGVIDVVKSYRVMDIVQRGGSPQLL
jgi:hypothetical protein